MDSRGASNSNTQRDRETDELRSMSLQSRTRTIRGHGRTPQGGGVTYPGGGGGVPRESERGSVSSLFQKIFCEKGSFLNKNRYF